MAFCAFVLAPRIPVTLLGSWALTPCTAVPSPSRAVWTVPMACWTVARSLLFRDGAAMAVPARSVVRSVNFIVACYYLV